MALSAHYHFEPRPVAVARGNEKGRVKRAIRYIRDNFFAGRRWSTLAERNQQADDWCQGVSAARKCPENAELSVNALWLAKTHAKLHRGQDRLSAASDHAQSLLQQSIERGHVLKTTVRLLNQLLDDYGRAELDAALKEALAEHSPYPQAVQQILERRLSSAKLGRFKPFSEFDWQWPDKINPQAIQALMQLDFLTTASNIILLGSNGVGKSTIAQNLGYQAVMQGHTVLFTPAANMLNDLAAQDGDNALRRRIQYYARPSFLIIDEVGYLSYSNRHADLLFEIINQRYEQRSTLVTTNRPFAEWNEVFPNAACVVSLNLLDARGR